MADTAVERRCVFCRIAAKEEAAEVVYEDSDYVCFRDRRPAATHHFLLIPRTHIRSVVSRKYCCPKQCIKLISAKFKAALLPQSIKIPKD